MPSKRASDPLEQKTCPVCDKSYGHRCILQHIRNEHPNVALCRSALKNLGAKHCEVCKKVVSITGKGKHVCGPTPREFETLLPYQPLGSLDASGRATCGTGTRNRSSEQVNTVAPDSNTSHRQTRSCAQAFRNLTINPLFESPIAPQSNPSSAPDAIATSEQDQETSLTQPLSDSLAHDQTGCEDIPRAEPASLPGGRQVNQSAASGIHYAAQTVPKGATTAFSQVTAEILNRWVAASQAAGTEHAQCTDDLFKLATRLLNNTNGSRRRGHKVHSNIKRYRQGVLDHPQPIPAAKKRAAEQQVAKQVHKQLTRGNISRATRALDAAEVAQSTPAVVEKLGKLHPVAEPPAVDAPDTVPVQITRHQLQQVVKRLPKGSAPGPSGWTFEHIQAVSQATPEGMDAVMAFVNTVLKGDAPDCEQFRASRLIALWKKAQSPSTERGVRPIAIGEVWARLVSMCAMAACPNTGPSLAPLQVGVGVKGGAQVLGHAIRAGDLAHPEDVTLQLDFKNAFNSLSREAMLSAVATRAPQLFKFAAWTYRHASSLLLPDPPPNTQPLLSRSGVRQGDPCGPLFFALALQDVLESVQDSHAEVRVIAYLDDTFLQGPKAAVADAFRDLQSLSSQIGLVMQPTKSTVYCTTGANSVAVSDKLGFQVGHRGIVAAGCPIGESVFVAEQAQRSADKVAALVDTHMNLKLPLQDKLLLMRKSLQAKVAHFARCGQFDDIRVALVTSEQAITGAMMQIIGREESLVDMEQLRLPTNKGGLGIQCLTEYSGIVCKAGFLAAAALAQQALEKGCDAFQPFKGESAMHMQELWHQVSTACTCKDACMCQHMEPVTLSEALAANTLPGLQRVMSLRVADTVHSSLLAKYQSMLGCTDTRVAAEQHLARLHSVQHSVSTAWLNILPVKDQWHIDNETVTSALRFMLGVSPGPTSQSYFRCGCGFQGYNCHHAMTCDKMSGVRSMRHNQIQNSVRYGCSKAGCDTSWEPKEGAMQNLQCGDDGYGRRGDILVSTLEDLLNVDIAVTHPAMQTVRAKASKTPGAAAEERAKAKRRYHEKNGTPGYRFVPFVVESYGRLGKDAENLLKSMADRASSSGDCDRNGYLHWIKKEISLSLVRGNARVFRRYLGQLIRGTGVDFQPGDDNPALGY